MPNAARLLIGLAAGLSLGTPAARPGRAVEGALAAARQDTRAWRPAAGVARGRRGACRGWPVEGARAAAGTIGGLWLDALRMTIVPLVVSLIVTGIAAAAATAGAGGLTRRAFTLFALLLFASA